MSDAPNLPSGDAVQGHGRFAGRTFACIRDQAEPSYITWCLTAQLSNFQALRQYLLDYYRLDISRNPPVLQKRTVRRIDYSSATSSALPPPLPGLAPRGKGGGGRGPPRRCLPILVGGPWLPESPPRLLPQPAPRGL